MTRHAERMDSVDRAGILSIRGLKSLQPARQLILGIRLVRGNSFHARRAHGKLHREPDSHRGDAQ
jgi:hypothetical protein